PLFSKCLARQCQQILSNLEDAVILEFGAGSGIMAADILLELESLNQLPSQYLILEISADLKQQQQITLAKKVPHLLERIQWLDSLPQQALKGIILANEVLDAMPIHRFKINENSISEFYVTISEKNNEPFAWKKVPVQVNNPLHIAINNLELDFPNDYVSEINLTSTAWIKSVADILEAGVILLIDYGFPSREYYHVQRNQGTLMCHYRHHSHGNPLILAGVQDITAHVDFTAIANAALEAQLEVAAYSNQTNFLLACGLTDLLSQIDFNNTKNYLQASQQVKKLILPHEMGELFKVMALTRQIDLDLLGFSQDDRARL
ncbi:MAG: SAM-dependent methyltransferase, partial [Thiomargarita sp.]|nr:SAM-dependent methyltransferase [Thiomargarita sp.]